MLERASKLLKDDGCLIYCVCSIIFSEGEGYWITLPIMFWTIISVQRSVEYSAGIKKDI